MSVCTVGDININYKVYGGGFPLVLIHPFRASLEFWAAQIKKLSHKYRIIAYDVRGHGLSSAPAGEENYTLDILVKDLNHLMEHLKIEKAYIGGLSLGGAIALGYTYHHPEKVKALLIFDIHGGFQSPYDAAAEAAMAEGRMKGERYAQERGMADFARRQIATGTAFPPLPEDEALHEQYIERMARCPVNGYIGVGRARPWEAAWQRQAADGITVPTLITVGSDDMDGIITGTMILHEHIRGSRHVIIKGSAHETAWWRPDIFNRCIMEFLEAVDAGRPVAGEMMVG